MEETIVNLVNELEILSTKIKDIYDRLYDLELSGLIGSDEYQDNLKKLINLKDLEYDLYNNKLLDNDLCYQLCQYIFDNKVATDGAITIMDEILYNDYANLIWIRIIERLDQKFVFENIQEASIYRFCKLYGVDNQKKVSDYVIKSLIVDVENNFNRDMGSCFLAFLNEYLMDNNYDDHDTLLKAKYALIYTDNNLEVDALENNFATPEKISLTTQKSLYLSDFENVVVNYCNRTVKEKLMELFYQVSKMGDQDNSAESITLYECYARAMMLLADSNQLKKLKQDCTNRTKNSDRYYDYFLNIFTKNKNDRNMINTTACSNPYSPLEGIEVRKLNKLVKIIQSIAVIYQNLLNLELQGKRDTNEYDLQLDYLDIALEVEDNCFSEFANDKKLKQKLNEYIYLQKANDKSFSNDIYRNVSVETKGFNDLFFERIISKIDNNNSIDKSCQTGLYSLIAKYGPCKTKPGELIFALMPNALNEDIHRLCCKELEKLPSTDLNEKSILKYKMAFLSPTLESELSKNRMMINNDLYLTFPLLQTISEEYKSSQNYKNDVILSNIQHVQTLLKKSVSEKLMALALYKACVSLLEEKDRKKILHGVTNEELLNIAQKVLKKEWKITEN